jgi:tryptophan synthase alpha chain
VFVLFEGKNSFIPFVTAGHPDLESTREVILKLAPYSSVIEIGIPFSDPIADGPTIQRSSFAALEHGYRMSDYIDLVRQVRGKTEVRLIFMTYLNPVLQYGMEKLDRDASEAGLDGLLISDLTPEEVPGLGSRVTSPGARLESVFLVAPTSSEERIKRICEVTTGFVYLVARTGVTGKQTELDITLPQMVDRIRRHTALPVAVGFGIRSKEDVRNVWKFADAAVVGSALVDFIEQHKNDPMLPSRVARYVEAQLLP